MARLERGQGPPTAAEAHARGWRPTADGPVDPGVVTTDPHPGEEVSYGPGMPVVAEWRRRALADLQTERVRRELLRWVRRVLTLGLWWR